jgi:hypothetical protein
MLEYVSPGRNTEPSPAAQRGGDLILRSRAQRGVSKDDPECGGAGAVG